MALTLKSYPKRVQNTIASVYSADVPFHYECYVCEHTLITNDEIAPQLPVDVSSTSIHVPGNGAIYRLIGDGTHTPTFNATFKKSGGSGDFVATLNTINLITFMFDGVDYWYNITQPA